jgi:hypothetical protein
MNLVINNYLKNICLYKVNILTKIGFYSYVNNFCLAISFRIISYKKAKSNL